MLKSDDMSGSDADINTPINYSNQQFKNYQQPGQPVGVYGNHAVAGNTNYSSNNNNNNNLSVGGISIGGGVGGIGANSSGRYESDNKSIGSTPSKISKFTYSEYPQIKPTNPLYTSTATIKTATSAGSRASTMNTVSRRQKYNPNAPRFIRDWRWVAALAVLFFFPTGLIAIGLAIKARTKFHDGFIDDAKKLNKRSSLFCAVSFCLGLTWILTVFFMTDKWPRTYG